MSVYVDRERNRCRRLIMCHMWADTFVELHDMAEAIGMDRTWFQPLPFPHYDVSLERRARALALGAIDVADRREAVAIRKRIREGWTEMDLAQLREALTAPSPQTLRRLDRYAPAPRGRAKLRPVYTREGE